MTDNVSEVKEQSEETNGSASKNSNVFQERMVFFRRIQKSDETLVDYLNNIRRLAKRCEFEAQEEWILRDQLVLGLRDVILQRRIMAFDGNPTLDQITNACEIFQGRNKDRGTHEGSQSEKSHQPPKKPTPESSPTKCKICNVECQYASWLKNHMKQHTDERTATCPTCQKSFRNSQNLSKHMVTHSDEKSVICTKCNKAFKCDRHLQQHTRLVHQPPQQLPCPVCQKMFKRESLRRQHLQSQHPDTDERSYECFFCRKPMKSLAILRTHLYEHSRTKNWLCTQCGMKFKSKRALDRHLMRVDHDGAERKPFACQECGRRFVDQYKLMAHGRVHSGAKPFGCSVCEKYFATKSNLRQHLLAHSEERPHECHLCEYKCKSRCNLKKHFRLHSRIVD